MAGRRNVIFSIGRNKTGEVNINVGLEKQPDGTDAKFTSHHHAILVVDFDDRGRPVNPRICDLASKNGISLRRAGETAAQRLESGELHPITASTLNPNGTLTKRDLVQFGGGRSYAFVNTVGLPLRAGQRVIPTSFALFEYPAPGVQ